VAGPPSPQKPPAPFPATVLIRLVSASTRRTRALSPSEINRLPAPSTVSQEGPFKQALVAGPSSPQKACVPFPATVVMVPVTASICRIRAFPKSLMNTLPFASSATPTGLFKHARVAGPWSPQKSNVPFPAAVLMTCAEAGGRTRKSMTENAATSSLDFFIADPPSFENGGEALL